jgi:hypothetical protein
LSLLYALSVVLFKIKVFVNSLLAIFIRCRQMLGFSGSKGSTAAVATGPYTSYPTNCLSSGRLDVEAEMLLYRQHMYFCQF